VSAQAQFPDLKNIADSMYVTILVRQEGLFSHSDVVAPVAYSCPIFLAKKTSNSTTTAPKAQQHMTVEWHCAFGPRNNG